MSLETDAPDPFQMAFDHSSISHVLTAIDGRLLHVNQAMVKMLGYTQDELMGLTFSKITHPDDLEASYELIRCLKAGEQESYRLEKRYLHRNGKVIWALVSTTLLRAADGKPLYFISDILDITGQKLANDKVKLLAAIVSSSDDAIYSKNLDGLITHWNASAEKLYGYTAKEALQQPVSILSPPGRSDETLNLLERIRRGEMVKRFETRKMHKDGIPFDVSLTISPIYDDSGSIIGASAIARDITARKRVEQNLIRSNQANRALSRCNEVMFRAENEEKLFQEVCEVVVKEAGYRLCWVGKAENDEGLSIRVISQAGLAQEYLSTVNITWADTERGRGPAGTCIRTRKPVLTQNIARDPNMTPWQTAALKHKLASSLAIPLIPDGDVFGVLTIYAAEHDAFSEEEVRLLTDLANDLSFGIVTLRAKIEHEKARRALQKNQKLFNDSQRLAKIGAWEFDVATGHVLWSDEVYRIHGLMKTDNPNQLEQAIRFYAPEDQAQISEAFRRAVEQGKPYDLELQLHTAQGPIVWVRTDGHAEFKDGKVIRVFGNIMDINARKQAEIEKEYLIEQLNQAQKMEAIGRLAGGVAHDFNNMLSVIQGYAELTLMEVKEDERLFTPLKEIHDAALRSAALTRQLLAFARKQPNHPRVLNLNETVTGMLSMLERLIGTDIQLVWRPSDALMSVMLDPSQVDQILANLIVNARDALQGVGEVVIETSNVILDESYCRTHADCSPGDYVLLSVRDNGSGMSEELIAQIFEPFFTTKGKGIGTGLGLSTVYGIVKQNKGSISVYSEPGVGSTFNIHLPVALTAAQEEAERVKVATIGGNETVLLVDDEVGILNMAKEVLITYGYRVIACLSAEEALVTAAEYPQRIDLLLSDVMMPGMNGKALSQQLTAQRPELRTLYMSGYTDNVLTSDRTLANGVVFLQKPFSVHALTAQVREVLDADR